MIEPRLRRAADRTLLAAGFLLPVLCLAALPFAPGWAARRFIIFYLAPIFCAFVIWLRLRLRERRPRRAIALDAIVAGVAMLRFLSAAIPASGHMLFFTYSGLTTRSRAYRWAMVALLAETTYFKLVVWHDARSWALGLGAGLAAAVLHRAAMRGSGGAPLGETVPGAAEGCSQRRPAGNGRIPSTHTLR